jgi:hypothetical protein
MSDMDLEERASEMEALQSMFPEELRVMGDETFELDVTGSAGLSLMLRCSLPPGYPSKTSPVFQVSADWLEEDEEQIITAELESLFVQGQVVIFNWYEFLKDRVERAESVGKKLKK